MAATNLSWFSKLHTESCVMIRDLADCPGSSLWRYFLTSSSKEKNTHNYVLQLQGNHDPATNAPSSTVKWPENATIIPFINEISKIKVEDYKKKLLDAVLEIKSSSKKSALFVDSLNPLVVLFDSSTVCSIIEELTSKFNSVITVVSSESLSIQFSTALTRLSSVIIRLQSYPSHKCIKVDVTLRKEHPRLGLKIEKKDAYLRFNSDRAIEFVNITQPLIEAVGDESADVKDKTTNQLSNLTFNLNLTENEKHARSNVQLPYVNVK